jgi:hypothetical protein
VNEVFPTRVGVHGMSVQKDQPPAVGAALVQFVPSDVSTFPLVPGAAYVSVDATKVVPLFLRIVQDVVPALVITRTHSTAITPALTRERVVSEACQSSMVVTGRFTLTPSGSNQVQLQVRVQSVLTADK